MAVRAIAYARSAAGEQEGTGGGIEDQFNTVRAALAERGWKLASETSDPEVSASEPPSERAGLGRALEALDAGFADALVVATLDRVTRSPLAWADIVQRSRQHGWTLLAAVENLDLRTDSDEMLTLVTECGRRFLATQTREAIKAAKARGVRLGRPVEHSPAARNFVARARAEGASLRQIADQLTAAGMQTPRGGRWHPNTVRSILNSSRLDAEAAEAKEDFIGPKLRAVREQLEVLLDDAFEALTEHLREVSKDLRQILAATSVGYHPASAAVGIRRDKVAGIAVLIDGLEADASSLTAEHRRERQSLEDRRIVRETLVRSGRIPPSASSPDDDSLSGVKSRPPADARQAERDRLCHEAIRALTTEVPMVLRSISDLSRAFGREGTLEYRLIEEAARAAESASLSTYMAGLDEQRAAEARDQAMKTLRAAELSGAASTLAGEAETQADMALSATVGVLEPRRRAADDRRRIIEALSRDEFDTGGPIEWTGTTADRRQRTIEALSQDAFRTGEQSEWKETAADRRQRILEMILSRDELRTGKQSERTGTTADRRQRILEMILSQHEFDTVEQSEWSDAISKLRQIRSDRTASDR